MSAGEQLSNAVARGEEQADLAHALAMVALMQATWWTREIPDEAVDLLAGRMRDLPDTLALQAAVHWLMDNRETWPTWNHIYVRYQQEVKDRRTRAEQERRALPQPEGIPMPPEVRERLRSLRLMKDPLKEDADGVQP